MAQTECSETSAYKIQTPGNHPKESVQHSGHGESLKSKKRKINIVIEKKICNILLFLRNYLREKSGGRIEKSLI